MHALVMELVDREDLSQRIARGAIPVPVENSICAAWRPIADLYALTVQSDERIGGVCRGGDDGSAIMGEMSLRGALATGGRHGVD